MRIQFSIDEAIAVLNRLEGRASSISDGPLFLSASMVLKQAISKELESNSARIDKVIETMKRSGYDERVVLDLTAAQTRIKNDDAERKEQFKLPNKASKK